MGDEATLVEQAEHGDLEGVRSRYRDRPPAEVEAAADHLREADHYELAAELYRHLLRDGETAASHFGLGQCAGKMYQYGPALQHLERAFALEPGRVEGAEYYAYILERHERWDLADTMYRRALSGPNGDDLWTRSHYAWFLEKAGRATEARAAYDDVLQRNPAYSWALKRYALFLLASGEADAAGGLLADAVGRFPANPFVRLNQYEFLILAGDGAGADRVAAQLAAFDLSAALRLTVELFGYYRTVLLAGKTDSEWRSGWEARVDLLDETVHRDFDDLTTALDPSGPAAEEWAGLVRRLLK